MNLYERVLSVLACRYVDEVIIGAPWEVTEDLIKQQNVTYVATGTVVDPSYHESPGDGYEYPRKAGILKVINSSEDITTTKIVQRIIEHRALFLERNRKKEQKEITEIQERDGK